MRARAAVPYADPRAVEAGLFLVVAAAPLLFTPFSAAPFVDGKLLALVTGALLLCLGGVAVDRTAAFAAIAWVAALCLASAFGLDPWWSVLGPENQGTGLVTLATASLLLCVGTGVDDELRSRIAGWLFWTGVVVSAVAVLGRFVDLGDESWQLGSLSSTLGHRVFVGGFVAAAFIASTTLNLRPAVYGGLVVLGSALAVSAARSAWIGAAGGFAVAIWGYRNRWRALVRVLIPVLATLAAWTIADRIQAVPEKEIEFSAAPRFGQLGEEGSAVERLPVWRANIRAWPDAAVSGTGPSTGWYAYLTHATRSELRIADRGYADAHNIVIETGTTTGAPGLISLAALGTVVLIRFARSRQRHTWALGASVAVFVVSAFQPLNVVLTPLLFLTAGLCCDARNNGRHFVVSRWIAFPVAVALALTGARLSASSLERFGTVYGSQEALRWSLRIEPRRFGTTVRLARHRALDHRSGDARAAEDARRLALRLVEQHPWNPSSRLEAADVLAVIGDYRGAQRLIDEHLQVFPLDARALTGGAVLALRAGDASKAAALARRALSINPALGLARETLKDATARTVKPRAMPGPAPGPQ